MMEKIITKNDKETKEVAKNLASEILNKGPGKRAMILALRGNLGAGKTTFTQGFAKGLGIKGKILSPTFVILKKYKIRKTTHYPLQTKNYEYFYHIDCYRLNSKKDLEVLGFKEIILNPKNIIAIEWPEKVKGILPKDVIVIKCKHINGGRRLSIKI